MNAIRYLCDLWEEKFSEWMNDKEKFSIVSDLKSVQRGVSHMIDAVKNEELKKEIESLSNRLGKVVEDMNRNLQPTGTEWKSAKENGLSFGYFADILAEMFHKSIKDEDKSFLQEDFNARVLGEIVFKSRFSFSPESKLFKVFECLVDDRFRASTNETENDERIDSAIFDAHRIHQHEAVKFFFPKLTYLTINSAPPRQVRRMITNAGFLDDDYNFTRKIYAEYFITEWFIENIKEKDTQKILLQCVLIQMDFAVVRMFLNSYLDCKNTDWKFSVDLLNESNYMTNHEHDSGSNIHLLAKEKLPGLMKNILDVCIYPVTISNNLRNPNVDKRNVLHVACKSGSKKTVEFLLEYAERNMSMNDMKDLLYQRDVDDLMPFHLAVKYDKIECIRSFFTHDYRKCGNKIKGYWLNELKMFDETPMSWTAKKNRLRAFKEIVCLAQEYMRESRLQKVFLEPHDRFETILHEAVSVCHPDVVREILAVARNILSDSDIKMFLFMTNAEGRTVLQSAISAGSIDAIDQVWKFAESTLTIKELREFLLATDECKSGRTILHETSLQDDGNLTKMILDLVKRYLDSDQIRELLLKTDLNGQTTLHSSVVKQNMEVFNQLWYFAVGRLDPENLRYLLMKRNKTGENVLLTALSYGGAEIPNKLYSYANNALRDKKLMHTFFSDMNHRKHDVFKAAARQGNVYLLRKCWCITYEYDMLTVDEIGTALIQPDTDGNTVLHLAAKSGRVDVLREILGFANSVLLMVPFRSFFEKRNSEGKTCLQIAREEGSTAFRDHLVLYARNILGGESLSNFLNE